MRFGGAEFIGKAFRYSHHRTSSGRHNLRLLRPVKHFCGFTLNARRAHRQLPEAALRILTYGLHRSGALMPHLLFNTRREVLRKFIAREQDHLTDLAGALGIHDPTIEG